MLSDPAAASAVVKAAAPGMGPGRTYVDCSTVDEATGESSASVISATGGKFLAAPVSGGWRDAAKGELLFICGGEKAAFDAASPLMDVMGAQSWHTGETPSHASRAKLMLQIMMGTMIGSLAECLALSKVRGHLRENACDASGCNRADANCEDLLCPSHARNCPRARTRTRRRAAWTRPWFCRC